jgi:hypothetical protein
MGDDGSKLWLPVGYLLGIGALIGAPIQAFGLKKVVEFHPAIAPVIPAAAVLAVIIPG